MCDRSSDPTQYDGAAPDDASSRAPSRSGAALTARQRSALAAYAETGDYDAAARRLGINVQTYKNTLHIVYRKLDVTSAIGAFRALGWLVPRVKAETEVEYVRRMISEMHRRLVLPPEHGADSIDAAIGYALNDCERAILRALYASNSTNPQVRSMSRFVTEGVTEADE